MLVKLNQIPQFKTKVSEKHVYPKHYFRWRAMRNRCQNKHNPEFKRYGARGIYVCDDWENLV